MADKVMPDKPGLWWFDIGSTKTRFVVLVTAVDAGLGVEAIECFILDGSEWQRTKAIRLEWLLKNGTCVGPVLTFEEADELRRHAAALEAQVEDLERDFAEQLEFDADENCEHGVSGAHFRAIADALTDGPGDRSCDSD